jgi:hypothetical protein
VNPIRDLPQRVFLSVAGWGPGIFSRHENFWWVPVVCPFLGAQLGVMTYDLAVGVHHDQAAVPMPDESGALGKQPEELEDHFDQLAHSSSYTSEQGRYAGGGERVNIHAIGGRATAGFVEPTGMVHVNEAFLDPKIKASADALFHRNRGARERAQAAQQADELRARTPVQQPTIREPLLQNP